MQPKPNLDPPIPPRIACLAACLPPFSGAAELRIVRLQGGAGLNNDNYRVTAGGQEFVLRVGSGDAPHLGIRREAEREAAFAAARTGIAPAVLYFDLDGTMVTQLVPGRHWQPEEFRETANLARLAETVRRLHGENGVRAEGSVYRRIRHLLESARGLGLELPPDLAAHLEAMHQLHGRREQDGRFAPGLCHNDLWRTNFLDDGEALWLLDWEFAGTGDGLYDLATLAMAAGYSEADQRSFLDACGYTQPGDFADLQRMKWLVRFFEGAWGLVLHGLRGSAGFDYLAYSESMFEKMAEPLPI